ncbi:hypothetical protein RJ639_023235, partial [Escallonia herrerae]
MGYIEEARENHVKKKVEEALRSKMKQKALKECDHYTAKWRSKVSPRNLESDTTHDHRAVLGKYKITNDSVLEGMKKDYMLQQDEKGSPKILCFSSAPLPVSDNDDQLVTMSVRKKSEMKHNGN